jgi:hypothetical protein
MAEEIKNPNTEEEYQPDLMTLEDEDGNEVTFEVIDALDHKGVHYLAVVEYAEDEEDVGLLYVLLGAHQSRQANHAYPSEPYCLVCLHKILFLFYHLYLESSTFRFYSSTFRFLR